MKYYKICRVRCLRCSEILEYENRNRLDSGRLQICQCRSVALDPAAVMYRILGNSEDYEDLSEEWGATMIEKGEKIMNQEEALYQLEDLLQENVQPEGIIEKYIKQVELEDLTFAQVYLEIDKKLEWYAENVDPDSEDYKELLRAYNYFAHVLAKIYLEDHSLA